MSILTVDEMWSVKLINKQIWTGTSIWRIKHAHEPAQTVVYTLRKYLQHKPRLKRTYQVKYIYMYMYFRLTIPVLGVTKVKIPKTYICNSKQILFQTNDTCNADNQTKIP